jgi:hypothetical protein
VAHFHPPHYAHFGPPRVAHFDPPKVVYYARFLHNPIFVLPDGIPRFSYYFWNHHPIIFDVFSALKTVWH